ncbi:MAG: hypothetical protein HW402_627 [Dehalococcoidales bacterium]|nr:hypothetical protein [Dehalococcoidales bacterium]
MSPLMLSNFPWLNGIQCTRLLWIASNEPKRIPEPDAATQHIFAQGHLVGKLAKKLFPGGLDVPLEDFMGNIAMTLDAETIRIDGLLQQALCLLQVIAVSRLGIVHPIIIINICCVAGDVGCQTALRSPPYYPSRLGT